jgi:hypothetical protein
LVAAVGHFPRCGEGGMILHEKIASEIPQLRRGIARCRTCDRSWRVDTTQSLASGWPKCCGYTMTIDSPEKRAAMKGK